MAKLLQQAFAGGEVSPDFFGRITDQKYQTGLAECRNFVVLPHGPVQNRAGFKFVREAGDGSAQVRLLPFTYNTEQTMVVEMGDGYARFHTSGATLLAGTPAAWSNATAYTVGDLVTQGGVRYYCILAHTNQTPPNGTYWYAMPSSGVLEIPTPYAAADLFDIHYVQSGDVLTLVHPSYAPRELRRLSSTKWTLTVIDFSSTIPVPTGGAVTAQTPTAPTYPKILGYILTRQSKSTGEESIGVFAGGASNDLTIAGNHNEVECDDPGADYWVNIYRQNSVGGYYGYIGTWDGAGGAMTFLDYNIEPDFSRTYPEPGVEFDASGDYPQAVTYHEQRRWFGGTNNSPLGLWATKSGTESNMTRSLVPRDDDALAFRVASREANRIRHLVPLGDLLPFTAGSEMRVTSINTDAITPTSVNVKTESYIGASNVQPVVVNTNIVYAAARGGHIREIGFSERAGGQATGDLSLRATHLFDTLSIRDIAYAKAPYPIVWAVSSNGYLLGLTYVPEQDVGAWHRHDTDGQFESVCCVAEGSEDALYVVVSRTIDGSPVRYIERMASRQIGEQEDCFFVDSGLTYDSTPATTISGLDHLEGKTVAILADGAVMEQQEVSGGEITLEEEASVVHIGLPYVASIKTLPLSMQVDAALGQGRMKNINGVYVRCYLSGAFKAGPSDAALLEAKWRTTEPYGSPPMLRSDEVDLRTRGQWTAEGQVTIQQSNPLPLTIVSMVLDVTLGG
ncbi:MAG: hypothetical protein KA200_00100 [Burkholderiales bacterium]|nr:hypothetical protein [Burkholderiales bacterium]